MEIVGRGFIAQHATGYFGDRFPHVTLIAAGVSSTPVTDPHAFEREAELVYEVIRRCREDGKTVVFLSTASAAMYGAPDSPGEEDGPVFPLTAYGRHKLALECVCRTAGARWLVLRLAHLVGSGQQPHQLLPALVGQLLSGRVSVYSGAARDLLDVRHMLWMTDALLTRVVQDQVVNLASGRPVPVQDVVDGLELRLGTRAERIPLVTPAVQAVASVTKLQALVPGFARFGFGRGYLPALLDRYTDDLTAAAHTAVPPAVTSS